jgi:folate-dependent phosphoribosylglycinamide formyltransferase PurN
MTNTRIPVAVCVSGGGRSLENLLQRQNAARWYVALVVSSSEICGANAIAEKHGIPLFVGDFSKSSSLVTAVRLEQKLLEFKIEWIVLAGFLKMFPILSGYKNRIINIHPALLPKFGGKGMHGIHVHKAVLQSGDRVSGATVHIASDQYDQGKIISRIKVKVQEADSPEVLAARVFEAECILLPETISKLVSGDLSSETDFIWETIFDVK